MSGTSHGFTSQNFTSQAEPFQSTGPWSQRFQPVTPLYAVTITRTASPALRVRVNQHGPWLGPGGSRSMRPHLGRDPALTRTCTLPVVATLTLLGTVNHIVEYSPSRRTWKDDASHAVDSSQTNHETLKCTARSLLTSRKRVKSCRNNRFAVLHAFQTNLPPIFAPCSKALTADIPADREGTLGATSRVPRMRQRCLTPFYSCHSTCASASR